MKEQREIVLPPHLFDRIRASAGEHGGIGSASLFDETYHSGAPLCAHGHAWGTCTRYQSQQQSHELGVWGEEPELRRFLRACDNDTALYLAGCTRVHQRISFEHWCELLNVKRGVEVAKEVIVERETVTA